MNAEVKHTSVILKQFVIIQLEDIHAPALRGIKEMEKCVQVSNSFSAETDNARLPQLLLI